MPATVSLLSRMFLLLVCASGAGRLAAQDTQVQPAAEQLIALKSTATKSAFGDFAKYDFKLDGVSCLIACPEKDADGRPWIWRARFWGHEPQFDFAMLKKGWHVCYCDVADLYGNDEAIKRWDVFYAHTQKLGFSSQPLLEGMSRGGLIVMRWASKRPEQVCGIYVDNAVMDICSWPGGLGTGIGGGKAWQTCLKAYGFDTTQARGFNDGPLANLEKLAKTNVPILAMVNGSDDVVPPSENSEILIAKYKHLGGKVKALRRPKLGHHPHSLKDPKPLVQFATAAFSATQTK